MTNSDGFEREMHAWSSWFVLFVQAPIDAVSDAYGRLEGKAITRSAKYLARETALYGPSGFVVRVTDSDWTVVLHRVGRWENFNGGALAKAVEAPVLTYEGEDTSGSCECRHHDADGTETRYQTSDDAGYEENLYDEMIEHAEELGVDVPRPDQGEQVDSYDALFAFLGIAPVMVTYDDDHVVLAAREDLGRIDRVDHLEF